MAPDTKTREQEKLINLLKMQCVSLAQIGDAITAWASDFEQKATNVEKLPPDPPPVAQEGYMTAEMAQAVFDALWTDFRPGIKVARSTVSERDEQTRVLEILNAANSAVTS